jgi:hypothetical protein
MAPAEVAKLAKEFQDDAASEMSKNRGNFIERINTEINFRMTRDGVDFAIKAPEGHIVVPQFDASTDFGKFGAWYVLTGDPPKRPPPFAPELGIFLIALHESEHERRKGEKIAPDGVTDEAHEQAGEIDADNAILRFLDDAHEPQAKEYWLQSREVRSFVDGLKVDNLGHDTATFLRVYEKTGREIDLVAFDREKRGLLAMIKARMDTGEKDNIKVANIMGAVGDILAGDDRQADAAKKLSPAQRAEAESFMQDAAAMGYEANPHYPAPRATHNGGINAAPDEIAGRRQPQV